MGHCGVGYLPQTKRLPMAEKQKTQPYVGKRRGHCRNHLEKEDYFGQNQPLLIKSNPYKPSIWRHHNVSYYAHTVRESHTTWILKLIGSIFLNFLLILGIINFIMWFSLRPHRLRFHIHEFSIPSLSHADVFQNDEILFNSTTQKANEHIAIYYDCGGDGVLLGPEHRDEISFVSFLPKAQEQDHYCGHSSGNAFSPINARTCDLVSSLRCSSSSPVRNLRFLCCRGKGNREIGI